jgi:hypothetical protein
MTVAEALDWIEEEFYDFGYFLESVWLWLVDWFGKVADLNFMDMTLGQAGLTIFVVMTLWRVINVIFGSVKSAEK